MGLEMARSADAPHDRPRGDARPHGARPAAGLSPFRRTSLLGLGAAGVLLAPLLWWGVPSTLGWLLAINVVTFAAYAVDKRAARLGQFRTPEATLHLLALVGGTPAALFAQQSLRHKTKDRLFQWVTTGVVMLQLVMVALFITRAMR